MPLPNNFVQIDGQDCTCGICLQNMKDGSYMYTLPCGHGADLEPNGNSSHMGCLFDTFEAQLDGVADQASCPFCRTPIETSVYDDIDSGLDQLEGATGDQLFKEEDEQDTISDLENDFHEEEEQEEGAEGPGMITKLHKRIQILRKN